MKKPLVIFAVVVVVLLILSFAKDMIVQLSVEGAVKVITGLPLNIKSFSIGLINTTVDIKGLMLFNPKGYKDAVMLDAPEIYVRYDLPALIKGTIHLEKARLNLKKLVVVKNEKGQLNLDSLKAVQQGKKAKKKPAEKGKTPNIKIDNLELKIGKAVYKDYSRGGAPSVQEFNVNIDERYTNITDPNSLVSLIVVRALMNTTISRLANFDLGMLKGTITETLGTAEKVLKGATVEAEKVLEGAAKTTETAVEGAEKTVEKATEGIKDVLTALPFGGKKEQ